MRRGTLGGSVIPDVANRVGVSQERLFKELRLPCSTKKARITRNTALSAIEQDRLYRVDKVLARAQAVFEDDGASRKWITRENRALGGVSPLSLLDTEAGYELVLDTLGRIAYGIIS
jgi:putative toxin-antitoxin system antitoxin component (TIGR02293 family)